MRYKMTSSHHQMIYPFDMSKEHYELIAYSEYFQSNTYLNGDNEEVALTRDFLEPEIVYYRFSRSLCIQGHPEWTHCDSNTSKMCLNLIDKYLINPEKKEARRKSVYDNEDEDEYALEEINDEFNQEEF